MSGPTGKFDPPILLLDGYKELSEQFPEVAKRLSWQHMDILTKPLRKHISYLESEADAAVEFYRQVEHIGDLTKRNKELEAEVLALSNRHNDLLNRLGMTH